MKINGKWYFNEVLTKSPRQEVNFDCGGVTLYGIYSDFAEAGNEGVYGYQLLFGDGDTMSLWVVGTWQNEVYRTWDFGAAYQEVSDEFYSWLTANAVQLSKPIPMTHPKGIKLLTKGKKCSEDIEVVPTFIETVEIGISASAGIDTSDSSTAYILLSVVENGSVNVRRVAPGETLKAVKNSFAFISGGNARDTQYFKGIGINDSTMDVETMPIYDTGEDNNEYCLLTVDGLLASDA